MSWIAARTAMLSIALPLVLIGTAAPVSAEPEAESRVRVVPARVRFIPNPRDLAEVCRSRSRIGACTEFRGQVLSAGCLEEPLGWRLEPEAQFVPYMFLWNPRTLWHEWAHVDDIGSSAAEHLHGLMARRFATEEACLAVAAREAEVFPKRMDGWKRASNTKRHPRPAVEERAEVAPGNDLETAAPAAP